MAPPGVDGAGSDGSADGDERWQWGHKCKILFGTSKKTSRKEEETQRVGLGQIYLNLDVGYRSGGICDSVTRRPHWEHPLGGCGGLSSRLRVPLGLFESPDHAFWLQGLTPERGGTPRK